MSDPDNLRRASLEVEDSGSDQNRGTTQAIGPSTCRNPSPVHRLKEAGCQPYHILQLVAKLETIAESSDEEARVDKRDRKAQFLYKLHIDLSQVVHVCLDGVGEVDQKVRCIFLDSTSRVEAHCGDNSDRATLDELLFEG